jgi:hypothetical protein
MFVMVRFGMWDAIKAEPRPDTASQFMTGIWHYGRALANIYTDRPEQAQEELQKLSAIRLAMETIEHYVGFATARTLMTIAEQIVKGELAYSEGRVLEGLAHL